MHYAPTVPYYAKKLCALENLQKSISSYLLSGNIFYDVSNLCKFYCTGRKESFQSNNSFLSDILSQI